MQPIAIIDRGRGPELADIRITVFDILPYLQAGWHPSSIALLFNISSAQVQSLMQYIEDHREAVLAANEKILARIAQGNPSEVEAKRQTSHAKLLALREKLQRQQPQKGNHESTSG